MASHVFLERPVGAEPHSVGSTALLLLRCLPQRGPAPSRAPHERGPPLSKSPLSWVHSCLVRPNFSRRLMSSWSGRWELNPRQPAWKAGTLPLSYARLELHHDVSMNAGAAPCSNTPHCRQQMPALVGRQGFEPWKPMATDLQSAPFGHLGTCPNLRRNTADRKVVLVSHQYNDGKEE